MVAGSVSTWMRGALKVDLFPDPAIVQFDWHAPIDIDTLTYWRLLGKRVKSGADAEIFREEFQALWKTLALRGFEELDMWEGERMQEFHKDDEARSQRSRWRRRIAPSGSPTS